jgi:hypothetical protein
VVTLVAAAATLAAILWRNHEDKPLPVVARLTFADGRSERAFFTPTGKLVSTQFANQPRGVSVVVWRDDDGDVRQAEVKVDRADASTGSTLLHLVAETGPKRRFETSNGLSMEPGESVKAYISDNSNTTGEVLEVGETLDLGKLGVFDDLLVVGEVGRTTEGGTPLLDGKNKVVGMLFAEEAKGGGKTWAIPIENIRASFPEAFE